MELDELKSAWNRVNAEKEKHLLNETEIQRYLEKRTLDITGKIGRNIRVGVIIIIAWIMFWFCFEIIFSPILEKILDKAIISEQLLDLMTYIEGVTYIFILFAIILFWIRYNKIEKQNTPNTNLRSKLVLHIRTLNSYKTIFYIILIIVLVDASSSFSAGFFSGFSTKTSEMNVNLAQIPFLKWIFISIAFLLILGVFITIYYFLFNLFFNKLYGKYLEQLKSTLKEFDEVNSSSENQ